MKRACLFLWYTAARQLASVPFVAENRSERIVLCLCHYRMCSAYLRNKELFMFEKHVAWFALYNAELFGQQESFLTLFYVHCIFSL